MHGEQTGAATINGFLVDARVTPITNSANYTVPSGQMLVVLSVKRISGTGVVTSRVNGQFVYQGNGVAETNTALNSFFNPISTS